jgi:RNA recognition motif-containing protein
VVSNLYLCTVTAVFNSNSDKQIFRQMNIYVGNLSFKASEQDVENLFTQFGDVSSARIIKDKYTGRSRGFAIVEMNDDSSANAAISALHEKSFMERNLVVNEARPRENNGGSGGGGFNRGGGDRNNGGGNRRY